jgi:hypothetical protein
MQRQRSRQMKNPSPDITFQLSDTGIHRVVVFADNARETKEAFALLARVAPEFQNLDSALKGRSKASRQKV